MEGHKIDKEGQKGKRTQGRLKNGGRVMRKKVQEVRGSKKDVRMEANVEERQKGFNVERRRDNEEE